MPPHTITFASFFSAVRGGTSVLFLAQTRSFCGLVGCITSNEDSSLQITLLKSSAVQFLRILQNSRRALRCFSEILGFRGRLYALSPKVSFIVR